MEVQETLTSQSSKREDYRIIPNYYSTNSLVYILLKDKVIGFVETYRDLYYVLVDGDNDKWKSMKKKRPQAEVLQEAEKFISDYIKGKRTNKYY